MPAFRINGARLSYVEIGDADGRSREALVALHGLAANLAFWYLKYAPALAARFHVILPDMRGHGRSEMTGHGYGAANLARDLAGLLDHLGIDRAHLLAHSYGGVAAMRFACEAPHRVLSLVVADSHIFAVRRADPAPEWRYGRRVQPLLDRFGLDLETTDPYFGVRLLTHMAQWRVQGREVSAELADLVGPLLDSSAGRTAAHWLKLMEETDAAAEIMEDDGLTFERLRALRFPILALYGDDSQARLTGDALLDVWPRAEFRRVRDAGHFFPTTRPDEVLAVCERFWAGELADPAVRCRAGERERGHFRSDRVYRESGAWYLARREDGRTGPFATAEDARAALRRTSLAMQT